MARFQVGDKVVPSKRKMPMQMQIVIGGDVGEIIEIDYWYLRVKYDWGTISARRNEFNRHRSF